MIGIIDYGVGNIKAFANIYKNFDMPYKIVKNINDLEEVSKLILPKEWGQTLFKCINLIN